MKKLVLVGLLLTLFGFSGINQESFDTHAERFYIQMFMDGEQSESVQVAYEDMTNIFKGYSDDPLYVELELMYQALGTEGVSAEPHRQKVMNILNERP